MFEGAGEGGRRRGEGGIVGGGEGSVGGCGVLVDVVRGCGSIFERWEAA